MMNKKGPLELLRCYMGRSIRVQDMASRVQQPLGDIALGLKCDDVSWHKATAKRKDFDPDAAYNKLLQGGRKWRQYFRCKVTGSGAP